MKGIDGAVVVITGASSGIGKAAALAFCELGARVVAGARRLEPLDELATECGARGAVAIPVVVDTTDVSSVGQLAEAALGAFGRMDVWINNAGVVLFSRFGDEPLEDFRRVLEVNIMGYVHGARVALKHFRAQGHGILINNSSILGKVPGPYTSAYVASKSAIEGMSGSLRQELAGYPGIHICNVLPGPIDTPIWRVAGNYTGMTPKPPPPVYDATDVVGAMVRCARRPRPEIVVGPSQKLQVALNKVAPRLTERLVGRALARLQFDSVPAARGSGNLWSPAERWTAVSGGFEKGWPAGRRATVVLSAAVGLALLRRRIR